MPTMAGTWPLVGRVGELRRMQGLMSSGARGLVLAGTAGVGKTRLAIEFLTQAERDGAAVVRITATQAASPLPLGAFAPLLPAMHYGESPGVDDRADLLRRCATFLLESAGRKRLVLFADDAHLLDDASATLVHQLAATGMAFVVATVRSGEAAPDPIVALWKDDAVERLEVSGLRSDSVEELLLAVLDGPVDRGALHRLSVASQGNMLFLRELVLGALEDGTLRNDVGIWRLAGPLSPSSRLGELVEIRLSGVTTAERAFLEVLSVGEPMGPAELALVGNLAVAEALERKSLITTSTGGRRLELRLGHSLYGDVLRAHTPVLRRREVCRQLADAVEATGARRREDVLRVAAWRLEGGSARPDRMLQAACLARWRFDFPLAERLAEAAIQSGAGFDASLLAAQLASLQGRGGEAEKALAKLAGEAVDDRQRGLLAATRLDNHVFHLGHIEAGLQMAEEAEASIVDPVWRDEIAAKRSSVLAGWYGPRAAVEVGEPLLPRAQGRSLVWAGINLGWALGRVGRLSEAKEVAERGRAAQAALTEPGNWGQAHLFFRNEALALEGQIDEAYGATEKEYRLAVSQRSPEAQAWWAWQLSKAVGERGYPHTAAVHARSAVVLFHELGQPQFELFALGYLALALAIAGDAAAAGEALARLDALELPVTRYWAVDILQARAWACAARGDLPSAREWLEEGAAVGDDIGDLVGEAAALHGLARLGQAEAVADRLVRLGRQIEGRLAVARAAHAVALAAGDEAELELLSVAFEEMGAWLLAAEAAADLAVAWRRRGDPRRAARAEQRATALASGCENPQTPALSAVKSRSRLTRAERETALLAVAGRANKEIAAQLGISVRTVENHLQHVYEKLGVAGRSGLAEGLEQAY